MRPGGSNRVAQVVLDIAASHAELAGDGRDGARLIGQQIDEMTSARHPVVFFGAFEDDVAVSDFPHGNLSATAATFPAKAPRISAALASRDGLRGRGVARRLGAAAVRLAACFAFAAVAGFAVAIAPRARVFLAVTLVTPVFLDAVCVSRFVFMVLPERTPTTRADFVPQTPSPW